MAAVIATQNGDLIIRISADYSQYIKDFKALSEAAKTAGKEIGAAAGKAVDPEKIHLANIEYAKLIGNLKAVHTEEVKLFKLQATKASSEPELLLSVEKQRIAQARADGDIGGMLKTGFQNQSLETQQKYIEFYEKGIPGAFATAADSMAQFAMAVGDNTMTMDEAWKGFSKSLELTVQKMLTDLTSLYIKMALFGSGSKEGGGMGGLFGMIGGAIGGLFGGGSGMTQAGVNAANTSLANNYGFSAAEIEGLGGFWAKGGAFAAGTSLAAYRNTIVTRPTLFAFARGGSPRIGLMGERAGSPGEAILPLTRTSGGDLGVKAMTGGTASQKFDQTVNVNIQPPAGYEARTERGQNESGGTDVRVTFSNMMASEGARPGSPANRMLRNHGLRPQPVRKGN